MDEKNFEIGKSELESVRGKKLSLNFSDKDEKENAKFNDARLVDILKNYPLLYNKSLVNYGDPDYSQWMWGEIANEMNEPHRKTTMNLPFTWIHCRDQWEIVKKALRYLSNPAAKSFRYPKQFRESLEFFQNYIRDQEDYKHTDRSQDLFLNYVQSLESLPFEKQLLLEKEILDMILSSELEFCAPLLDPQAVESQAQEEFGNVIGLLMPEVDLDIVRNEMTTEPESENVMENATSQEVGYDDDVSVHSEHKVQFDLDGTINFSSEALQMQVPQMENIIQYSMQEVMQDDDLNNIIEEDVIEEDENLTEENEEDSIQEDFPEDAMQEDIIEEVVCQGPGKDMPNLDMDGQYDVPENRFNFSSVLNDILE